MMPVGDRAPGGAPRAQRGLTLVELMIALLLGLVLAGGAIQVFISSKQGFRANDALARIQERGRYALLFLASDLRMASFWGCAGQADLTSNVVGMSFSLDGEPIEGTDHAGGSDEITLRGVDPRSRVPVVKQMPRPAANLFLDSTDDIEEGDVLVVTDCEDANIFMVTNNNENNDNLVHNAGVTINGLSNSTAAFTKAFGESANVYGANERTYTVDAATHTLVRTVNNAAPEQLVDGIEAMEIVYGVDTDSNRTANAYLRADQVADWGDVVSVRVELLVRSDEDNILDEPQRYTFPTRAPDPTTAPDRRLRQIFAATIAVRNRLP